MQAIQIIGFKNSGKTALTSALLEALEEQGQKVAVVKHSHHPLDKPHTDTARLRKEGRTVLALGQGESALFWGEEKPLTQLLPLLEADIVLIEGGKQYDFLPRILCLQHENKDGDKLNRLKASLALATYGTLGMEGIRHFTPSDSLDDLASLVCEQAFLLPNMSCGACGHRSCFELAEAIVAQKASTAQCAVLQGNASLYVGGRYIPLNPFTARMLCGAVRGMVQELKGVEEGRISLETFL